MSRLRTAGRVPPLALAILLLAAGLYLTGINRVSFWEDESWMAIAVRGDLPDLWRFATERGLHPPLYFYLGWFYTRLTGDGELALRWLAGLCALVGIAWTYRLGADIGGRRAGLYAALLAAGSLFLIYFARLARQYTLFFALSAALACVFLRTVTSHQKKPSAISRQQSAVSGQQRQNSVTSYQLPVTSFQKPHPSSLIPRPFFLSTQYSALSTLFASVLYTHYFGAWMGVVLGLAGLLILPRRAWGRLIGALAVGALLFLPWIPSIISQFSGRREGLGYVSPDFGLNLRAYLDRVFNGEYALGFLLVALGIITLWRLRHRAAGIFLLIWLTAPLLLSLLLNTRFAWFIERNMIFTLPGVCVLMGVGLAWVSRYPVGKIAAPVAALVFVALGLTRYDTFWPFITPDWRSLTGAMSADARPTDRIVLDGEPFSLTYYLDRDLPAPVTITPLPDWLAAPLATADRLWLVDAQWAVNAEAHEALPDDTQMTRKIVLGVLVAEFYQRPPAEIATTFGDQIALGWRPPGIQVVPGERITLDLWWRALRQPDEDYSVGVYLVDAGGNTVAQQDGGFDQGRVPALLLPTDRWTPDARVIPLPAGLAPGEYRLTVAVYDWRTGERLIPTDGLADDAYLLATVRPGG